MPMMNLKKIDFFAALSAPGRAQLRFALFPGNGATQGRVARRGVGATARRAHFRPAMPDAGIALLGTDAADDLAQA